MKVADMFAGAGGFTLAAVAAGCVVVWAGNHWPEAVETHAVNHPTVLHACQDHSQADPATVPSMDILVASPACQGHSPARGKDRPHHDAARATAWAVVTFLEFHRPPAFLLENVPAFLDWVLYPAWRSAVEALGYSLSPYVSDAADHGVPQNRLRVFIAGTRSRSPVTLKIPRRDHVPASSFIDFDAGSWSPIDRPGRSLNTLSRIAAGRASHGERFLAPYYGTGSGRIGRSLARPIGTITTRARWSVIDGQRMRMLTVAESMAAMSIPKHYVLPSDRVLALHMIGNAVAPLQGRDFLLALKAAL